MAASDRPGMDGHVVGGKARRQAFILGSAPWVALGTLGAVGAAYAQLPFRVEQVDPLRVAATWSFVAMLPYAAVCLVILRNRLREGSHNPTVGGETPSLVIHCRVMQNTLEQLVWFALCVFPLATVLGPAEIHLLPIASVGFVVARLAYWRGYFADGTLGRRYGVQMTFTLNIGLLVLTAALLILRAP